MCLTCIKLPSVFKTLVLSIFEWPPKTGLLYMTWVSIKTLVGGSFKDI